jgi:hypothetical protein
MNTARDVDIATAEVQSEAEQAYEDFMSQFYGKRQRPDKPAVTTPPSPSQPSPQPLPATPEAPNGAVYG